MGCLLETLELLIVELYLHLMCRILPRWRLSPRAIVILEHLIEGYAILLLVLGIFGGIEWLCDNTGGKLLALTALALILLQIGLGCIVQAFNKK